MFSDSAGLVLFAIRSAVKLGIEARHAYVDSTRRREIVLPLPNFFSSPTIQDAVAFFKTRGKRFVDGYERDGVSIKGSVIVKRLLVLHRDGTLREEDGSELMLLHTEYENLHNAELGRLTGKDGVRFDADEFNALITVRQWRRGADPTPSTLQRLAGTLIEIGIDYAQSSPDLYDRNSSRGKLLNSFLNALDEIDFAEGDLAELPARLFVATLETAGEAVEAITSDNKLQELVRVTTKALSANVAARLQEINSSGMNVIDKRRAKLRVEDWAELVFRSTLTSAGRLVVEDPERFLGVKGAGEQALVTRVGSTVLDLILDEKAGLDTLLSRAGVESVLKSALSVVGEHPEILLETDNQGLRKLLSQVATDLSKVNNLLTLDVVPEVMQLVLANSAKNLHLLWPELAERPEKNLLLTAAKTALTILSRKPADGERWKPSFGKQELLVVVETVLDELADSPAWLLTKAGRVSPALSQVLTDVLAVIRDRGDRHLGPELAADVLRTAVKTAALRMEFLQKLPAGAHRAGERIISAAIDAVFAQVFSDELSNRAAWQLLRGELISGLVSVALRELAKAKLNAAAIEKLEDVLNRHVEALRNSAFDLGGFAKDLNAALAA